MVRQTEILRENKKYFDKISPVYHKRRRERFGREYANRILAQYEKVLGSGLPKADVLLDMGCGVGKILLNLKIGGAANEIYGIDISRGMLRECMANSRALRIEAHLLEGNVESLPFMDHSFNLVIGHAFLHHIPQVEKVFSEAYRVLRPEGMCIFTEPSQKGSRLILSIQRAIWFLPWVANEIYRRRSGRIKIELHTFSHDELERFALNVGFKNVFTRPYAGFTSRIFYWIVDPIAQRIRFWPALWAFACMTYVFYLLDEGIFKKCVPKDWYDEVAIVAQK